MKLKLSKLVIFLVIPAFVFAQTSSNERLSEMKNSFALGLQEKGLEIASELMSRDEYKDVREETVFYIAEYHFTKSFIQSDSEERAYSANVSYTYYLVYKNDYPNSKYSSLVEKRMTKLISAGNQLGILQDLFDYYYTEASIVTNSINFTNILFTINTPSPYNLFFDANNTVSSIEILERYYDDIIVNHPEFEIYGYYWKIISNLTYLGGVDYFSDGLMKFIPKKFSYVEDLHKNEDSEGIAWVKKRVMGYLAKINEKYSHHPLTLDLNIIYVNVFCIKDGDTYDNDTKTRLEFVMQNELDKTHPRYMLAKEFLLNNKFK